MAGLYKKIIEHTSENNYPMHMPGHKRNLRLLPDYSIDMTEIEGFDNLHHPEGALKECMDYAAKVYKSLDTFFVINGATGALHGAIYACTNYGDKIMIARNCHKSVYNMLAVRGLRPVYLSTDSGKVLEAEIAEVLKKNPDIRVAVITSPSYDGRVCDVKKVAKICHENKVILIVDEAHGAHLPFAGAAGEEDYFTKSAMYQGADLVVQSLHKTLPAMTQTAVLHRMTERIHGEELLKALSMFETSSPSYVLMASIDECIRYTFENRKKLFDDYKRRLISFWQIAEKDFSILFDFERLAEGTRESLAETESAVISDRCFDPGKILICGKNLSMTGGEIYDILVNNCGIIPEMYAGDYCLCMTSICDSTEGFERLTEALKEIAEGKYRQVTCKKPETEENGSTTIYPPSVEKYYCTPAEAERIGKIAVRLEGSLQSGRPVKSDTGELVCGDMVAVYPPGAPVLVPGEYINKESIDYIKKALMAGNEVIGIHDGCIIVLAEE